MKNPLLLTLALGLVASAAQAQNGSDDCATATPIAGLGSWAFDTTAATDSGLLASCNVGPSADIWYAWTAPTADTYMLSSCGASYDLIMTVYNACGGAELGCSDGYAIGFGACMGNWEDVAVTFPTVSGGTYIIQIDGYLGYTGTGVLDAGFPPPAPPNDDCANATPLAGEGFFPVSNISATDSGTLSTCNLSFGGTTDNDTWYAWTPATSGPYDLSICGVGFDILLAAYDVCGGTELACSAGYAYGVGLCIGGVDDVLISPTVVGGTTYMIQIEGWAGQTGSGFLEIEALALPPVGTNYCISTVNSTGAASTISATAGGASSASISANDLVLTADNLPSQPGIFIAGPNQAQIPFFNGFLCIAPMGLQRFLDTTAAAGGTITESVDYATSAAGGLNIVAGSSYNYQR